MVTKAVKREHFFLGLGEGCGQLMWAQKPALSPHVFILSASTSLDFLSFSALTSSPIPAPFGFFVSVSLSVRSLSATQGNGQTRPERAAPQRAGAWGTKRAAGVWQAAPSTKWFIQFSEDQSRRWEVSSCLWNPLESSLKWAEEGDDKVWNGASSNPHCDRAFYNCIILENCIQIFILWGNILNIISLGMFFFGLNKFSLRQKPMARRTQDWRQGKQCRYLLTSDL